MRHEVTVVFDAQRSLDIPVDAGDLPAADAARRWLDDEFVRLDCTPLRASGKLLTADKLVAVAQEVGPSGFGDSAWRSAYGRAACAVMGRPAVRVDLLVMAVRAA
jgi:hypothetical protein